MVQVHLQIKSKENSLGLVKLVLAILSLFTISACNRYVDCDIKQGDSIIRMSFVDSNKMHVFHSIMELREVQITDTIFSSVPYSYDSINRAIELIFDLGGVPHNQTYIQHFLIHWDGNQSERLTVRFQTSSRGSAGPCQGWDYDFVIVGFRNEEFEKPPLREILELKI